jgi:glycosyltransferase involved in cell wall biosynthesis
MDRLALIASSDALLIPSRWHAGSLVALQAMAAGRPVLAARGDAGPDLARAGAFVIHENTSRGWRETLETLDLAALDRSAARRHAEAAEARFAAAWIALLAAVSPVSGAERGRVAA